jgi:hypothetical protein
MTMGVIALISGSVRRLIDRRTVKYLAGRPGGGAPGDPAGPAAGTGSKRSPRQPRSSDSTLCGAALACASIAVPACCRICARVSAAVSLAKSASTIRPRAAA